MFNPLYLFNEPLLDAFIKSGKYYFVRNLLFCEGSNKNSRIFLITHYDDPAKASAHLNSIEDPFKKVYKWNEELDRIKLIKASTQPEGYQIYSTLFLPNWKDLIDRRTKESINRFMFKNTNWKPLSRENIHINFYFQFGKFYFTLSYNGNKITGKFEELEF